jgi:hypothetical protein
MEIGTGDLTGARPDDFATAEDIVDKPLMNLRRPMAEAVTMTRKDRSFLKGDLPLSQNTMSFRVCFILKPLIFHLLVMT